MQTFDFSFNGNHTLILPDGDIAQKCAYDIITGASYPLPSGKDYRSIVDIGAHAGEFTIMAALIWPKAKVHAYEPFPGMAELLRENLKSFPNVVVHEAAVDNLGGMARLYQCEGGTLCNTLLKDVPITPLTGSVEVVVDGADKIAALEPDFLKIDAEGVESQILLGLRDCDALARIDRIALEFHSEVERQVICELLDRTHSLMNGRIFNSEQGELTYVRRT